MTLSELSNILVKVLSGYKLTTSTSSDEGVEVHVSLTLPSMGTFIVEHTPSQIVNEGNTITPPSLRIIFDSSLVSNNESIDLIIGEYKAIKRISVERAEDELLSLVKEIKLRLLDAAFVEFPGFGIIRFSEESHFVFEPDPHFDPAAEYYGLEPLPLKIVADSQAEVSVGSDEEAELGMAPQDEGYTENVSTVVNESVSEVETSTVKRGFPLALSIVLAVVLLFVILVLAVLVFKEDLMPLLERLLYSKEELQFLRENGL